GRPRPSPPPPVRPPPSRAPDPHRPTPGPPPVRPAAPGPPPPPAPPAPRAHSPPAPSAPPSVGPIHLIGAKPSRASRSKRETRIAPGRMATESSAFERRLRRRNPFLGEAATSGRKRARSVGRGARGGVAPSPGQSAKPPSELFLRDHPEVHGVLALGQLDRDRLQRLPVAHVVL